VSYNNVTTSIYLFESRDSSVGIATGYGLDDQGSGVLLPVGAGNYFSSPLRPVRF
jgi:hypothetical protein